MSCNCGACCACEPAAFAMDGTKLPPDEKDIVNPELEEFFARVVENAELRRPKPTQEAIAEALRVVQRVAGTGTDQQTGTVQDPDDASDDSGYDGACGWCGCDSNLEGAQFCAMCGAPLVEEPLPGAPPVSEKPRARGHYHYHFHHYYHARNGSSAPTGVTSESQNGGPKTIEELRRGLPVPELRSTREGEHAAIRKAAESWAQACNTKQIDKIAAFYTRDAVMSVGRNKSIRGAENIREFFQGALEAGWGDVALQPAMTEQAGSLAIEMGRCTMLVPESTGMRREERVSYTLVFVRQGNGELKAALHRLSSNPEV